MNDRIRELALQAVGGIFSYDGEGEKKMSETEYKRFAELIVRECADIVKETRWAVQPSQEQLATSILTRFGVEK